MTVAICTHNRARLLERTLASLAELATPDELDWQVLVVANACTDRTPALLASREGELPLKWCSEPKRGHSHARNRAVEEAEGDFLIWTDDDVRVASEWLQAYLEAFERWPEADFFGGPIEAVFEGGAPDWLSEAFSSFEEVRDAYAHRDIGSEPIVIDCPGRLPYGGNMAFPLDVQERYRYDPRLGRSGSDLVGGDELDVFERLLDEGKSGRWVPSARVEHVIEAERQTERYLRRYFYDQGRIAEPDPADQPVPRLLGRPRWAWRARVQRELEYRIKRLFAGPQEWIPSLIDASFASGVLASSGAESRSGG